MIFFVLVESYSLTRDIQSAQKKPLNFKEMFLNPPLVILNGFSQEKKKHLDLIQSTIQHMFPSINIDKVFFIFFYCKYFLKILITLV